MTTTLETYAISIESCNIAKRALYDAKATVGRLESALREQLIYDFTTSSVDPEHLQDTPIGAAYIAHATNEAARKDRRDRWVLDHYSAELADIETAKRDAAMAEAEYEYRNDVERYWRISCEAENAAQV